MSSKKFVAADDFLTLQPQTVKAWYGLQIFMNQEDPFNKILNILDIKSTSIQKHGMKMWVYGIIEFLKPRNFETKQPCNQITLKPINQATKKTRNHPNT